MGIEGEARAEAAHADAGSDPYGAVGHRDRVLAAELVEHCGGYRQRLLTICAGKQDGELVAAEAADDVCRSDPVAEKRREPREYLVADGVAECVVDALEMVHVDDQDGALAAIAAAVGDPAIEVLGEATAIQDAGQWVIVGELL